MFEIARSVSTFRLGGAVEVYRPRSPLDEGV